jgi:hypothetical protein
MTPLTTRSITRPNTLTYANTFERMSDGTPFSVEELVDVTGWHPVTVGRLVRALHRKRVLHVSAWLPDTLGRDSAPVYMLGNKRDKSRKTTPPKDRSRAYRARKRSLRQQENMKGLFQ